MGFMCLAVPGKIVNIEGDDPAFRTARVSFGGVVKEVSLAFTPDAKLDDYVLVHVGFALNIVDEAEANRVLADLETLGELAEMSEDDAVPDA
jgi:hydrogenase expression/formation protein HypC